MTNDEIRARILQYKGAPFLCGEYATYLDVTWHRMKRVLDAMVNAGEVEMIHQDYWKFYRVDNQEATHYY